MKILKNLLVYTGSSRLLAGGLGMMGILGREIQLSPQQRRSQ
jgi:hypothetical protein